VVDERGLVLGILTEMDILSRLEIGSMELWPREPGGEPGESESGTGLRFKTLRESLEGAGDLPVSRLMTSPVRTARPEDLVQEKAALMVHRRIRRLPVVDGKGVLVGILSRKDLIRMLARGGSGKRDAPGPRKRKKGGSARA